MDERYIFDIIHKIFIKTYFLKLLSKLVHSSRNDVLWRRVKKQFLFQM